MTNSALDEHTHQSDSSQLEMARELVSLLEQGNDQEAERLMANLAHMRESALFQEMGRLTRQLHNAINGVEIDESISRLAIDEMPETRERLQYIIKLTEDSAHKTLNAVEASMPVSDKLISSSQDLNNKWHRFTNRELKLDEFKELSNEVNEFFQEVNGNSNIIRNHLTDILMAQDFHDLTGQVIKRVIGMVEELEENLVDIIRKNGSDLSQDEDKVKTHPDIKVEGPLPDADRRDDVVSSQDDVDDLLSSLGF